MYPLTPLPLFEALFQDHAVLKLAILLSSIVLLAALLSIRTSDDGVTSGPPLLPLSIFETVWPFFRERYSFIAQGFQFAGPIFRFKLLRVCQRLSRPSCC